MDHTERERLYQQSLVRWGTDTQLLMLFEEMAELTVALNHCFRDSCVDWEKHTRKIAEEIADVKIMLEQIMFMFEIPDHLVAKQEKRKLFRLKRRLSPHKIPEQADFTHA